MNSYIPATSISTATDAVFGSELDIAQQIYDSSAPSLQAPVCDTNDGFVDTGQATGYTWDFQLTDEAGNGRLVVDVWKRTFCTKTGTGTITPIDSITGTGSTTGISKQDIQDAMVAAMKTDNLTGIQQAVQNGVAAGLSPDQIRQAFLQALQQWGGGTGGITQAQAQQAFQDAMKTYIGDPSQYTDTSSWNQTIYSTGGSVWDLPQSQFQEMQGYSLYGSLSDAFMNWNPLASVFSGNSLVEAEGSSDACSPNVSLFGGDVHVDFSSAPVQQALGLFGDLFLVVATLFSMFIIFGRA